MRLFLGLFLIFLSILPSCNSHGSSLRIHLQPFHTFQLEVYSLPILSFPKNQTQEKNIPLVHVEDYKNFTIFSIVIDPTTRIPSIMSPYMNCSFNTRLRARIDQKLLIQNSLEDYQFISMLFIDGILRNKCIKSINRTVISYFDGTAQMKSSSVGKNYFLITNIEYNPFHLKYNEILSNYAPLSTSMQTKTCIDELYHSSKVDFLDINLILLWPFYYSNPHIKRSIDWQIDHITQSLTLLIDNILSSPPTNYSYHIILPSTNISSSISHEIFVNISLLEYISITFIEISSTNLSYPNFFNLILSQIQTKDFYLKFQNNSSEYLTKLGLSFFNIQQYFYKNILLVSSHIYPYPNMIFSLIHEITSYEGDSIIGGTLFNMRNEIDSYGYEFYEFSYIGGLEKYLLPYARYRYTSTSRLIDR